MLLIELINWSGRAAAGNIAAEKFNSGSVADNATCDIDFVRM